MSKNERLQCLDEWVYDTRLYNKAERRKALAGVNPDTQEYFKSLIKNFKTASPKPKRLLIFKY